MAAEKASYPMATFPVLVVPASPTLYPIYTSLSAEVKFAPALDPNSTL